MIKPMAISHQRRSFAVMAGPFLVPGPEQGDDHCDQRDQDQPAGCDAFHVGLLTGDA